MAAKTSRSSVAIIPAVKRPPAGTTVGFFRYCFTATPPAPTNATPSATIPAVMESVCAYQPPGYASSSLLLLRFKSGRAFARTHEHWKHMHSGMCPSLETNDDLIRTEANLNRTSRLQIVNKSLALGYQDSPPKQTP